MRTIETEIYKLSELSEDAQATALDQFRELDYDWWEFVYDDAKTLGKILGVDIENIFFSGFSSQGDGACFEGKYEYSKGWKAKLLDYAPKDTELLDIGNMLQEAQRTIFYQGGASMQHRGHYMHPGCMAVTVDYGDSQSAESGPEEGIMQAIRELANWIYAKLKNEYGYQTSDDVLRENIEANEYEFEVNGTLA